LFGFLKRADTENGQAIIVVSGLPRSGTSMAMTMLEAGGIEVITDQVRTADEDNPKGYYELERVKQLPKDSDQTWLKQYEGRGIKIVSHFLKDLPASYRYRVVFMNRAVGEVVASQNKMLDRRGTRSAAADDTEVAALFEEHMRKVKSWLEHQPNFDVLHVAYSDVIENPEREANRIAQFLGLQLDCRKMAEAVDRKLYRNRKG